MEVALQDYHGEPHAHETPAPPGLEAPGEVVDPPYPGSEPFKLLDSTTNMPLATDQESVDHFTGRFV